jgi:hypothetical protein
MKLDKSILDATLAQIAEVDKRMTASAGNVTQRKTEALETIQRAELEAIASFIESTDGNVDNEAFVAEQSDKFPVTYLAVIEAELEAIKVRHEEAKQAVQDAIVASLKASKADTGAELASLRTERDELVNTAKAMATLLKVKDLEIPKAPKGSGSSSGSPRVAKSSTGSHYVKAEDGTLTSYANDTFSGLAFYAFKRAGVPALKSALEANGVTELTKPWETTVTVNGITRTIGHRVETSESAPAASDN